MKERLQKICAEALEQIKTEDDLEQIRIRYLGKKGELTAVLRGMGQLSAEERPVVGQLTNEVRARIENALQEKAEALKEAALTHRLQAERVDVTAPGKPCKIGHRPRWQR